MKRLAFGVALAGAGLGLFVGPAGAQPSSATVTIIALEGAVDPLVSRYVERGIRAAERDAHRAVLLRIDTPGGLDSSMRRIIRGVLASEVPVVCWVGPAGARAASAGALILTGCPLAAMAPGTNMGAAHPVGFQGEILDEKVTNDAAAYARGLAQQWGRNPDFAERMVRRSDSVPAPEALELGSIDLLATGERELLDAIDGRTTKTAAGEATFRTRGARVERFEMTFMESLLHNAVDPNIAFLLLTLGLLGIVTEILHPGITVGGVAGTLALLAALVILGMLPVNIAGILLVVAGIGLMVAEVYVPGGVVGALGLTALVLGGLFLFDASVPGAQVSKGLLIGIVIAVAAFFAFVVRAVIRTRRQVPAAATTADLVGLEGVVERALAPAGIVRARNETWSARSASGDIPAGARVRVTGVDGLTLEVEPVDAAVEPSLREAP